MVKCPYCNQEMKATFEDVDIAFAYDDYIDIKYTEVLTCTEHGRFLRKHQTKKVPMP